MLRRLLAVAVLLSAAAGFGSGAGHDAAIEQLHARSVNGKFFAPSSATQHALPRLHAALERASRESAEAAGAGGALTAAGSHEIVERDGSLASVVYDVKFRAPAHNFDGLDGVADLLATRGGVYVRRARGQELPTLRRGDVLMSHRMWEWDGIVEQRAPAFYSLLKGPPEAISDDVYFIPVERVGLLDVLYDSRIRISVRPPPNSGPPGRLNETVLRDRAEIFRFEANYDWETGKAVESPLQYAVDVGQGNTADLSFEECFAYARLGLDYTLDIGLFYVKDVSLVLVGDFGISCFGSLAIDAAWVGNWGAEILPERWLFMLGFQLGPVPVTFDFSMSCHAEVAWNYTVKGTGAMGMAYTGASAKYGWRYTPAAGIENIQELTEGALKFVQPTLDLDVSGRAELRVVPTVTVTVCKVAPVELTLAPYIGVDAFANDLRCPKRAGSFFQSFWGIDLRITVLPLHFKIEVPVLGKQDVVFDLFGLLPWELVDGALAPEQELGCGLCSGCLGDVTFGALEAVMFVGPEGVEFLHKLVVDKAEDLSCGESCNSYGKFRICDAAQQSCMPWVKTLTKSGASPLWDEKFVLNSEQIGQNVVYFSLWHTPYWWWPLDEKLGEFEILLLDCGGGNCSNLHRAIGPGTLSFSVEPHTPQPVSFFLRKGQLTCDHALCDSEVSFSVSATAGDPTVVTLSKFDDDNSPSYEFQTTVADLEMTPFLNLEVWDIEFVPPGDNLMTIDVDLRECGSEREFCTWTRTQNANTLWLEVQRIPLFEPGGWSEELAIPLGPQRFLLRLFVDSVSLLAHDSILILVEPVNQVVLIEANPEQDGYPHPTTPALPSGPAYTGGQWSSDGSANILEIPTAQIVGSQFVLVSLRLLEPATSRHSIYWAPFSHVSPADYPMGKALGSVPANGFYKNEVAFQHLPGSSGILLYVEADEGNPTLFMGCTAATVTGTSSLLLLGWEEQDEWTRFSSSPAESAVFSLYAEGGPVFGSRLWVSYYVEVAALGSPVVLLPDGNDHFVVLLQLPAAPWQQLVIDVDPGSGEFEFVWTVGRSRRLSSLPWSTVRGCDLVEMQPGRNVSISAAKAVACSNGSTDFDLIVLYAHFSADVQFTPSLVRVARSGVVSVGVLQNSSRQAFALEISSGSPFERFVHSKIVGPGDPSDWAACTMIADPVLDVVLAAPGAAQWSSTLGTFETENCGRFLVADSVASSVLFVALACAGGPQPYSIVLTEGTYVPASVGTSFEATGSLFAGGASLFEVESMDLSAQWNFGAFVSIESIAGDADVAASLLCSSIRFVSVLDVPALWRANLSSAVLGNDTLSIARGASHPAHALVSVVAATASKFVFRVEALGRPNATLEWEAGELSADSISSSQVNISLTMPGQYAFSRFCGHEQFDFARALVGDITGSGGKGCWNDVVRPELVALGHNSCVCVSAQQVMIMVPQLPGYSCRERELVSVTVPTELLASSSADVMSMPMAIGPSTSPSSAAASNLRPSLFCALLVLWALS